MSATPPSPPLADLVRRPDLELEIHAVLALDPASWLELARRPQEGGGGISSETIVHLVRHLQGAGDPGASPPVARGARLDRRRLIGELVLLLDQRATKIVQAWAQGFDEATTEDIALEVGQAIMEHLLAETPDRAGEFLEIAFNAAVKRRTLNAVEKRNLRLRLDEDHGTVRRNRSQRRRGTAAVHEALHGGVSNPEADYLTAEEQADAPERLRKGLEAIENPRHREAVILHHLRGWPIIDKDPDTQTVCKHLGVSDRQIRNMIASAFHDMRKAIGEKS